MLAYMHQSSLSTSLHSSRNLLVACGNITCRTKALLRETLWLVHCEAVSMHKLTSCNVGWHCSTSSRANTVVGTSKQNLRIAQLGEMSGSKPSEYWEVRVEVSLLLH